MTKDEMIEWFKSAPKGSRHQRMLWAARKIACLTGATEGGAYQMLESALIEAETAAAQSSGFQGPRMNTSNRDANKRRFRVAARRQKETTMTIARICKCRTRWTVELKNSVIGVGAWWTVVRTFDTREHADRFCQAHGYILSTGLQPMRRFGGAGSPDVISEGTNVDLFTETCCGLKSDIHQKPNGSTTSVLRVLGFDCVASDSVIATRFLVRPNSREFIQRQPLDDQRAVTVSDGLFSVTPFAQVE